MENIFYLAGLPILIYLVIGLGLVITFTIGLQNKKLSFAKLAVAVLTWPRLFFPRSNKSE